MKIIHMSDLHVSKSNYQELKRMFFELVSKKRIENYVIVITGDLTDNGNSTDLKRVKTLLQILNPAKAVLIVPGNHDYFSLLGNGFFSCESCINDFNNQILNNSTFPKVNIIDKYMFIGLNSAHPNFFASGKIGDKQLKDLKDILDSEYSKIAKEIIVYFHHHPFNLSKKWYQFWKYFQEKTMELQDSKKLLHILENSATSIVLFGHKHSKMGEHKKGHKIRFFNAGSTSGKDNESPKGFSLIRFKGLVSYLKRW